MPVRVEDKLLVYVRENCEATKVYNEIFDISQTLFFHSLERKSNGKLLGIFKITSKIPNIF